MASRTIFTDIFRASYANLAKPYAHNPTKDVPKYSIKAMFPHTGMGAIAKIGVQFQSTTASIMQAMAEAVQEEWGFAYDPNTITQVVKFPPTFENGNTKLQRDANQNPIIGTIDPIAKDHWLISFKNETIVGTVGPDGKDIDPSAVYSGCWCRAQIEVSAYTSKENNAKILSVKLLNIQMAYDDEAFGRAPVQAAASAFAGMAIPNTNIQAGTGQVMAPIGAPTMTPPVAPPMTPAAVTAPVMAPPAPPALPATPPPVAAPAVPVYVHTATDNTEKAYRDGGWTTELLVQHGKGRMETPAPAAPAVMTPPAPVMAPPAPAAPALPVTPPAPPVATVPLTGKVIMKPGSQYTYEQLIGFGWNDDQIIAGGYATPNFTNPA